MERRSTLPVNEILAAERRERSWDNAAVSEGWSQPSMTDRGRGVGDLGMAGLNIGAPASLQRGGRALPPTSASTPLGRDPGELPRTCSGSSTRADYRQRLELNAQDSDEDVLFRREMNYPERGVGGFSGLRRAGTGENRGCISRTSPSMRQRPRRALREAGDGIEATRTTGPVLAVTKRAGASTRRTGGLPDAGERIRIRRSDHRPGRVKERTRPLRRSWVLGWKRFRA